MTCKTCHWFEHEGDPEWSRMGHCHRNPPAAIASRDRVITVRPSVTETDRCGEWKAKA